MLANQEEKWEKLKILDFLRPGAVVTELTATTKKGVLEELVGVLAKEGKVKDAGSTVEVLMEREKLGIHRHRPGHRHSACQDRSGGGRHRRFRVVPARRAV